MNNSPSLDSFPLLARASTPFRVGGFMKKIRVAIVGVGNCASSLVQGVHHYRRPATGRAGLIHDTIGGYGPGDIEEQGGHPHGSRRPHARG